MYYKEEWKTHQKNNNKNYKSKTIKISKIHIKIIQRKIKQMQIVKPR